MISKYSKKKSLQSLAAKFTETEWAWLSGQSEFIKATNEALITGDMLSARLLGDKLVKETMTKQKSVSRPGGISNSIRV